MLGYGVEYRGRFGWQLIHPERAVRALVNVDAEHLPTLSQIEDAIASVHGTAANTYIFGHHKIVQKTFSAIKQADVMYVNTDNTIQTVVGAVNGVRIVGSYNLPDGTESAVA